jgi:hypothetical protein
MLASSTFQGQSHEDCSSGDPKKPEYRFLLEPSSETSVKLK